MTTASTAPAPSAAGSRAGGDAPFIAFDGVGHRYVGRGGEVDALAGIEITIGAGEFVSIVGPSGCGKTTLLKLVAGFERPGTGTVTVAGDRVRGPGPDRGVVFQRPNLYPWLSVRDNVALGPRFTGVRRRERRRIADEHLALVGLAEFGDAAPYELSGGMQQRAQIAAVLANRPAILLLDEPFGALDTLTRERLQDELRSIWAATDTTALLVTHGVEEAVYLGTRVLVMSPRPGRVVADIAVPFAPDQRTPALRATPEFQALRERIGTLIGGH